MKIYRVGGAVRDALLGLPVQDIDYVVVGSTPEQMIAAGYIPVGKDFPVFLHPVSKAEYALARTERKSAPGYRGFVFHCAPDVTLEQDLARRDLTINAMAVLSVIPAALGGNPVAVSDINDAGFPPKAAGMTDCQSPANPNQIIDPFGGQRDLAAKVLRHVSDAFAEDPVRILRVARFAARFDQFTIAPETMQLMRVMVASGEVDALVPERTWQEVARGLMEAHPSRLMTVLYECGALARIMPELESRWMMPSAVTPTMACGAHMLEALDFAAQCHASLAVRWAVMLMALSNGLNQANADVQLGSAVKESAGGILNPVVSAGTTESAHFPLHSVASEISMRLKAPTEVRELACLACKEYVQLKESETLSAELVVNLLLRCDGLRRPKRLSEALQAVQCFCLIAPSNFSQQGFLEQALTAARSLATEPIAQATALRFPNQPQHIAQHIYEARVQAVRDWMRRT
jgi:tRNA nucleotidyltransferase (CCA-adding enzyme)